MMCMGINSPGTLNEVLRGYLGDKQANKIFNEDKTILFESYPRTISPTIGMEHFITDNISFAGECRYNMLNSKMTINDVESETSINYILPIFMLRMYW